MAVVTHDPSGLEPQDLLAQAVDALPHAQWLIDDNFRIIGFNEGARRACIHIWQREPKLGESVLAYTNPASVPRFEAAYRACLAGETRSYPREVVYPSGLRAFYELSYVPLRSREGSIIGCVFTGFDVTARRSVEERLTAGLRLETMAVLAGGLAHDFNNLLTAAELQAAELLTMRCSDPVVCRIAQDVRGVVQRAAALIDQLRAFGRREQRVTQRVEAGALVERAMPLVRAIAGRTISVELEPGASSWCIDADPSQIERVLVNLAANARDAMPEGGRLTLAVAAMPGGTARADTGDELEYVCLRVRDTGVGMDDATRARAFEPFFTTRQGRGGTGLGLAASWGIVTQHGGTMRLTSAPGMGTTVDVLLPRASDGVSTARRSTEPPAHGLSGVTVLLVDDDDDVRLATARQLGRAGAAVLTAHDRASALAFVEDGARTIDLAVIDGVMRVESGLELAQQLIALRPNVAVVVFSGLQGALDAAYARGFGVLSKPFSNEELLSVAHDALARRTYRP